MLTAIERENVTKAAQCAALLVGDVRAITQSSNPLLAEIGLEALKAAADLEQRLKRLETITADTAHLYLWVPNALLPEGIKVLEAWGFSYKSNIVWHKVRKDGGPDGRGVGFYFRNVTELVLFGVRGKNARTLAPGRRQVNFLATQKREHSRKPDEFYDIVESCSPGPYLELFARGPRDGWDVWGNQADEYYPTWPTYSNHSQAERELEGGEMVALGAK